MRFLFAQTKMTLLLMGALLVAFGIAILANPVGTTVLVTRIGGVACAISGALMLLESARLAGGLGAVGAASLVAGGLPLAFGLVVALFPDAFVSFLFTLVGIGITLTGVGDIMRVGGRGDVDGSSPGISRLIGMATVVVGVLVIIAPFAAASVVPLIAGVALVVDGASEVFLALCM